MTKQIDGEIFIEGVELKEFLINYLEFLGIKVLVKEQERDQERDREEHILL